MIDLRGTSHVAADDIDDIRVAVRDREPDVVALELDPRRLQALLHGDQGGGRRNPFLMLLKTLQDFVGRKTGVAPGSDMVAAYRAAVDHGIDVALIDQDIAVTVRKMGEVPLLEKVKFVGFLLLSPLLLRDGAAVDLRDVPERSFVDDLLLRFHISFPSMYEVLVGERNRVMAARLRMLDEEYGDVLAFVGAGHISGIQELLDGADVVEPGAEPT